MPGTTKNTDTDEGGIRLNINCGELEEPRKMTPATLLDHLRTSNGQLSFVLYEDPKRPEEPTTLLSPFLEGGSPLDAVPEKGWNWGSVTLVSAGRITATGEGLSDVQVSWSSHTPENPAAAEAQVKTDFATLLSMAQP